MNILLEIKNHIARYEIRTGCTPSCLYLGENEWNLLDDCCDFKIASLYKERVEIYDLPIFRVDAEHHIGCC